jgi:hypothetical protein
MPRRASSSFTLLIRLSLISGLVLSGCGYRPVMSSSRSPLVSNAGATPIQAPTRLAVMAIRNDSPEPWLNRVVTDALKREMAARGAVVLVEDPHQADLVLRGRVRPLFIEARSFSSFVAALEYSVTVALDLEVVRASGDIVQLDAAMLTETDIYLASADIETTRTHKLEALRRISDLLASRIADSIELLERPMLGAKEGV